MLEHKTIIWNDEKLNRLQNYYANNPEEEKNIFDLLLVEQ